VKLSINSIDFDLLNLSEVINKIDSLRNLQKGGRVITPNLHFFSEIRRKTELRDFVNEHECILCDGVPLVWLSRLTKKRIPVRIAGSDFLLEILRYSSEKSLAVSFIGGNERTLQVLKAKIQNDFPGIREIVLTDAHFSESWDIYGEKEFLEKSKNVKPEIFIVGLGFPKQEQVSKLLIELFPNSWFLNIGMGINYLTGDMKRSPVYLQNLGLEWLWRLFNEPKRLFRRYVLEDIPTFIYLLYQTIRSSRDLA
jgi:N-acetylglucosaminyldiphosphoundecaprenol N-acetyl-beta-D-mannosaminyltransferase